MGIPIGETSWASTPFSLSSASTVNAITYVTRPFDTLPSSLDWAISTEPNGGTVLGSGTASSFTLAPFDVVDLGTMGQAGTFSIAPVSLPGGAYYLTLRGAEGPDTYYYWLSGLDYGVTGYQGDSSPNMYPLPSQVFTIFGDQDQVPEPSTWLLVASSAAALALRRLRTAPRP